MPITTLDARIGTDKLVRASELLKVAAHPQRLAILDLLGGKKRMCVSDLVEVLGIEQAILSQHLTLMRDKGLLGVEKEGKYSFYYLEQPGFLKIIKDLENCCEHLWSMEILGYIGAVLMGLSLGLIGGGGSILTVPILVYLFSIDTVLATAYSLFIVGLTALIGSFSHMRMGNIDWKTALSFGAPSIVAVFATRAWLVPALPDPLFWMGTTQVSKALGMLIFFALLMVAAAYSMIRQPGTIGQQGTPAFAGDTDNPGSEPGAGRQPSTFNYPLIMGEGLVVGTITGLVGAGGGFLIIPALVLLAKLPMKLAVGTSLIIIAAKSLIGFTGDLKGQEVIDWNFLLLFSAVAVGGIIAGSLLSRRISNEKLKPAFGWFVLVMGVCIITRELSAMA